MREKNASVRLKNFERRAFGVDSRLKWVIESDETYIYQKDEKENLVIAYEFTFEHYDGGDFSGRLKAKKGRIDYETRLITVEGNVRYEGRGQLFTGSNMTYNMDSSVLESRMPVTILEKGLSTLCRGGIVVDREEEREVCRNPAGVSFSSSESGNIEQLFR